VETWALVQLGKRHSTSLQTRGWHLHHSPLTQWTAWTYLQERAAEDIHPHSATTGFLTFFIVSHFCLEVTLVHFHMYARLGMCHYWTNELYAACYTGHWHPIGWEKAFYCSFHMDTKEELLPFVMLINSVCLSWN
jgi:beta-galactoside alpha-2,6-sialyltransferase (sialyltransferase 1)